MEVICQICKKEFKTKPYSLKKGWGKFCSKACYDISQSKKEVVICENCNKEVLIKLSRKKLGQFKFCSKKCQREWFYKRSMAMCPVCRKEFYNKWQLFKYCSKECYIISMRGKNNPQWNGGTTPIRKSLRDSSRYKIWMKTIFTRDNWTCQECGRHRKIEDRVVLEVHHDKKSFSKILQEFLQKYNQLSPVEDKEDLLRLSFNYKPFWDLDNGKTLCRECHHKTNTHGVTLKNQYPEIKKRRDNE